ncbi:MAG TPA: thioredoxin family protein [Methylomirabilota bacterium]|jgi:thiol-disulfide isomerase/thioredoxin
MRALAAILALAVVGLLSPAIGTAGEPVTYSKPAFIEAQNAGKPIVVFVTASWCPNCRKQQPLVDQMSKDQAFANTVIFVVDFDSDKQALRDLNAQMQSTLIAFKGKTERMRSTAVTNPEKIRELFQSAL